jgi:hypothetical protein
VLYRHIPRQRLGENIPVEAYAPNNMSSIARQRIIKQAFLTNNEAVLSAWSLPMGYKGAKMVVWVTCQKFREFSWRIIHLCQSFSSIGLGSGDDSRNDWQEMARKESDCERKTSCVNWIDGDGYKSVVKIRLMKTEKSCACVTVNCEVWK